MAATKIDGAMYGMFIAILVVVCFRGTLAQTKGDLRLQDGPRITSGRVEQYIRPDFDWVTICDDWFGKEEAKLVCRYLNANEVVAAPILNQPFGVGSGRIFLYGNCGSDDTVFADCTSNVVQLFSSSSNWYCSQSEAVGVNCVQESDPLPEMRLVGGTGNYSGILQINMYGEWGTVCGPFDTDDARVACRHMGLPHKYPHGFTGLTPGSGPIVFASVNCAGNEKRLDHCEHDEYPLGSVCQHDDDIFLVCKNNEDITVDNIQAYDGGFTGQDAPLSLTSFRMFRIQEGAIVKFICPIEKESGINGMIDNAHVDMYWLFDGLPLGKKGFKNPRIDGMKLEEHVEMYQLLGLGFNGRKGKLASVMTYTARKEDNNKVITCEISDEDSYDSIVVGSSKFGTLLRLYVLPGPTPLKFKSTVGDHVWPGGFVGNIDIPIDGYYNSWKIVLKFPKKVFRISSGNFNIAPEPCLHKGSCTKSRKTWIIYNTYENRVLSPIKGLHLFFVADVAKTINRGRGRGLVADVKFYGYNKVFASHLPPNIEPFQEQGPELEISK